MNKKVLWITRTAALLALLICLQWVGSQIPEQMVKQLVTGTFVNAVLAVTVLIVGYSSGITLALISPVLATVLGIAANPVTVIPIMLGNVCYVVLIKLICGKSGRICFRSVAAVIGAAAAKFAVLYLLVVQVICGVAAPALMGQKLGDTVLLGPKMLPKLTTMFTWPQLITALAGGTVAILLVPVLRKALKEK